jgi:hypothetical protein
MKLSISKTKVVTFSRKTNTQVYDYKLCQSSITRIDSIKDLKVLTDSKLQFYNHADYVLSQCIKLLCLVRSLTISFSVVRVHTLHFTWLPSNHDYASVFEIQFTTTVANKLERNQQQPFVIIVSFLVSVRASKTPHITYRRYHLHPLFLIQVYRDFKYCPSLLEAAGLRDRTWFLRDFSVFNFGPLI